MLVHECVHMSKLTTLYNYVQSLYTNYTSIKLGENGSEGGLTRREKRRSQGPVFFSFCKRRLNDKIWAQ